MSDLIERINAQRDELSAVGIHYKRGTSGRAIYDKLGALLTEAAAALEAAREDAERYRWLCDGNGYFMEEAGLCHIENEKPKADEAIDKAMRGEW